MIDFRACAIQVSGPETALVIDQFPLEDNRDFLAFMGVLRQAGTGFCADQADPFLAIGNFIFMHAGKEEAPGDIIKAMFDNSGEGSGRGRNPVMRRTPPGHQDG